MNSTSRPRRRLILRTCTVGLGVLAALGFLYGLSELGFFPWSTLNCSTVEVDLQSGRIRSTRYLFGMPVRRSIQETPLSEALALHNPGEGAPLWQPSSTISPRLHHSPHYRYHGAAWQAQLLGREPLTNGLSPKARRLAASRVRELWHDQGNDGAAERYLEDLGQIAQEAVERGETIDSEHLPEIPAS